MQFPVYLSAGPLRIHPHLAFEVTAYVVGFAVYLVLRRSYGDPARDQVRWWVIAAAFVGASLGSRLLASLENPQLLLNASTATAALLGGKTIIGGLIGGLIAVEWIKRRMGETQRTGDLFAVPLAVGIAIGRVGCFLTGLDDGTYGSATSLPWGVDFGDGVRRHPTQLYEVLFCLGLAVFLWRLMRRPHVQGDAFKVFMVGYMGWRFAVDFVKPGISLAGITTLQWACVAMLVYYARDMVRWLTPHRTAHFDAAQVGQIESRHE
jgi:phosphatidylglycerol:prolipoprotein diacylglycerol transferase